MNRIKDKIKDAGMTMLGVGKILFPPKENEPVINYEKRISYKMYRLSSLSKPKRTDLLKIAEFFNCSIDDLI
jgi:hypothetical protein